MKKILISIIGIVSVNYAYSQDSTAKNLSQSQVSTDTDLLIANNNIANLVPLLAIGLVVILIIQMTKYILDNKLKNKIIDRGISEQLANSIIEKSTTHKNEEIIKWAFLSLGISGGLTLVHYTKPLDIHSLAIISFSIGISFLLYYFFLKNLNK